MLTHIRKATNNWLFKGVLAIIAVSFCIWEIGDALRSREDDRLVTFKYSEPITTQEFMSAQKNEIQRIQSLTQTPLTPEQIKQLNIPEMVLQQLINVRMLAELVKTYDIDFSNNLILEQIKKQPIFQDEKGNFDTKLLAYALKGVGINEETYINRVKAEIAEQIIISIFASNALTPNLLVQNIVDYFNEQRTIDIMNINTNNIPNSLIAAKASREELQNYYNANKDNYSVPESREFTIAILAKDTLKKDIKVSDAEIEQLYKDNFEEYNRPELYSFYNLFFADYESAKKAIESFKSTDKKFEEAIPVVMGRPAHEFLTERTTLNGFDKNIAATLKTSNQNSLSDIIKTYKGYHVIKKVEQIPAVKKSFASVRPELLELIKKKKLENSTLAIIRIIEDELLAGTTLNELAKKFNLKLEVIKGVTKQNLEQKLLKYTTHEIREKLFNLKEKETSEFFELNDNMAKMAIIEATKITPLRIKNFDEVSEQVAKEYKEAQKLKLAYNMLNSISLGESKSKNGELIRSITNYKISRADLINPKHKYQYPVELMYKVFLTEKGKFTDIISDGKTLYLARISDIKLNRTNSKLNKKTIEDKLHTNFNNSIFEEIILNIRDKNKVKVSDKAQAYINSINN